MPYTDNELAKELVNVKVDITAIRTTVEHIQSKLEKSDAQARGIHALASTVEKLATTIEQLAEKTSLEIEAVKGSIKRYGERLEKLEHEPATKWKNMTNQIIALLVSSIVGLFIGAIIMLVRNGGV